jgi:chromate transporter
MEQLRSDRTSGAALSEVPYRTLFLVFLRLGATAYGGPAMMAYIRREIVERRRWVTAQDFTEGMALCQMLPGATMVQMCTYVGYRCRGSAGALLAALGFILPASMVMVALSALYARSASLPLVDALFRGLGAVVVAIVLDACVRFGRTSLRGWQGVLIALAALGAMAVGVNFVLILAGAAASAVLLYRKRSHEPRSPRSPQ